MTRRRVSSAASGTGRFYLSSRRFDESIHQLTTESIDESLSEIAREFEKRFGKRGGKKERERQKTPAD